MDMGRTFIVGEGVRSLFENWKTLILERGEMKSSGCNEVSCSNEVHRVSSNDNYNDECKTTQ